MPKDKLSKASRKALDIFGENSQCWGYLLDQGFSSKLDIAEKEYKAAKLRLERRIARLEREIEKLQRIIGRS